MNHQYRFKKEECNSTDLVDVIFPNETLLGGVHVLYELKRFVLFHA